MRLSIIRVEGHWNLPRQSLISGDPKGDPPSPNAAEDLFMWILTHRGGRGLLILWGKKRVRATFSYLSKDTF